MNKKKTASQHPKATANPASQNNSAKSSNPFTSRKLHVDISPTLLSYLLDIQVNPDLHQHRCN